MENKDDKYEGSAFLKMNTICSIQHKPEIPRS